MGKTQFSFSADLLGKVVSPKGMDDVTAMYAEIAVTLSKLDTAIARSEFEFVLESRLKLNKSKESTHGKFNILTYTLDTEEEVELTDDQKRKAISKANFDTEDYSKNFDSFEGTLLHDLYFKICVEPTLKATKKDIPYKLHVIRVDDLQFCRIEDNGENHEYLRKIATDHLEEIHKRTNKDVPFRRFEYA